MNHFALYDFIGKNNLVLVSRGGAIAYINTHAYSHLYMVVLIPFDLFRFSIGTNSNSLNSNKIFDLLFVHFYFSRLFRFLYEKRSTNSTRIYLMQKKTHTEQNRTEQLQRKTRTSNHWTHVWFYFHSITSYFTLKYLFHLCFPKRTFTEISSACLLQFHVFCISIYSILVRWRFWLSETTIQSI